jgi:uncharacterized protein YukE
MKQMLANAAFPFALFVGALSLLGCDQTSAPSAYTEVPEPVAMIEDNQPTNTIRSTGNMLYVIRDIADLHLRVDEHVEKLQHTQRSLQIAFEHKNTQNVQQAAEQLKLQLTEFNQALDRLNLKSQEIESIRENIQHANQQALASTFLNGQIDLSKLDLAQLEKQMSNVQNEMLKLAAMFLNEQAEASSVETLSSQ